MNIQGWFPLGLTGLISLQSKGLSRVFSSTTIWKHQFFSAQSSLWSNLLKDWHLTKCHLLSSREGLGPVPFIVNKNLSKGAEALCLWLLGSHGRIRHWFSEPRVRGSIITNWVSTSAGRNKVPCMEYDLIWGQGRIPGEASAKTWRMNRSEIVGDGGREKNIPGNLESGWRGPSSINGVHAVVVVAVVFSFLFIFKNLFLIGG